MKLKVEVQERSDVPMAMVQLAVYYEDDKVLTAITDLFGLPPRVVPPGVLSGDADILNPYQALAAAVRTLPNPRFALEKDIGLSSKNAEKLYQFCIGTLATLDKPKRYKSQALLEHNRAITNAAIGVRHNDPVTKENLRRLIALGLSEKSLRQSEVKHILSQFSADSVGEVRNDLVAQAFRRISETIAMNKEIQNDEG